MKTNRIPGQEDEIRAGFGAQMPAIPGIDELMEHLIQLAFSMYLGERCKYCGKKYKTLEDLKDTVWAGAHADGHLACRPCWVRNNLVNIASPIPILSP